MELQFQTKPWDLYACTCYAIFIAGVVLFFGTGNLTAILLVFFVPGYVLVAVLFPGNSSMSWIERLALSLGVSMAIVPLMGLLLNFTPWGIRFVPVVATVLLFSLGVGCVAYWRRMRLPPHERLAATLNLASRSKNEDTAYDKALTVALAASVMLAVGTVAYVVLTPLPGETFTEFYVLGADGRASGYPTVLNVSQPGSVILGVVNHEAATVNYSLRVDLVGVRIVYNATAKVNQTMDLNRTTLSWINLTLADGRNWTQPYIFSIRSAGVWKLQFLLYINDILSTQRLHFIIRVS